MSQPLTQDDDLDDLDDLLDEFAEDMLSKPPGSALKETGSGTGSAGSAEVQDSGSVQPIGKATGASTLESAAKENGSVSNSSSSASSKPPGSDKESVNVNATAQPNSATDNEDDPEISVPELDEQFAEKLKLGMDSLLKEFEGSAASSEQAANLDLEALLSGLMGPQPAKATAKSMNVNSSKSLGLGTDQNKPVDFQSTIEQTMDRLKESKSGLDEAASAGAGSSTNNDDDDPLISLFKSIEGASGMDGGLEGILDEMLKELASKDILYEPVKEMHDKYPAWLADNRSKVSEQDLARYQQQLTIVSEICVKFEDPNYDDDDAECKDYITSRMNKMQETGAPPPELMGDLASGSIPGLFDVPGQKSTLTPDLDNCNVQ